MARIEGTRGLKEWKGEYDFAVDGGAVSTITLRSNDGPIPNGSIIEGGLLEVDTALTSGGAATVAVQSEAAGDIQAAAAISGAPWSSTGRKSVVPAFTGATTVKTTAARNPAIVVATAALTAGKFRVILFYR
jgi:hypothetical protein